VWQERLVESGDGPGQFLGDSVERLGIFGGGVKDCLNVVQSPLGILPQFERGEGDRIGLGLPGGVMPAVIECRQCR
jgi:hypothetical protein